MVRDTLIYLSTASTRAPYRREQLLACPSTALGRNSAFNDSAFDRLLLSIFVVCSPTYGRGSCQNQCAVLSRSMSRARPLTMLPVAPQRVSSLTENLRVEVVQILRNAMSFRNHGTSDIPLDSIQTTRSCGH